MRLAAGLVDKRDNSHRRALAAGYSWRTLEWALATAAAPWAQRVKEQSEADIRKAWMASAAEPVSPYATDAQLRALAERRAELMLAEIGGMTDQTTPEALLLRLDLRAQALDARPLAGLLARLGGLPVGERLEQVLGRLQCHIWWRRQLRRAVVTKRETMANRTGEVSRKRRQVYVTDDSVARKAERNASNAAMLAATEIEDAAGEVITLAQAVAASTANKAIRRGELMTRIRGAEEWATRAGMVGLFTTNTLPSRFHAVHHTGQRNHRHSGDESEPGAGDYGPVQPNSPRDGQNWLCKTWARCRSALARKGLEVFGFRVAEPHHDGCPHWHMLLWARPERLDELREVMRDYWLAENGNEPGAQEYRFKAEAIRADKGGAVAYVAKYISKNIDDVGAIEAEGHTDAHAGEQGDLFGATARRVEAWASGWRIRQFQAIGQPPVTVWRELRRVSAQTAEGGTRAVQAAHAAVNRTDTSRANWGAYMDAQGGAMVGRHYRVRIVADEAQRQGRYGVSAVVRPLGVCDANRPEDLILSDRREWKPRGGWTKVQRAPHVALWRLCVPWERQEGARVNSRGCLLASNGQGNRHGRSDAGDDARQRTTPAVHPWTRVNNCTGPLRPKNDAADLLALLRVNFGKLGGCQPEENDHEREPRGPSGPGNRSERAASGHHRGASAPPRADLRQ